MSVVRWERDRATGIVDPLHVDDLAGHVLILDGVGVADDERLEWCHRAPCVVIGCTPADEPPAASVDIALTDDGRGQVLERVVANIVAHPQSCRVLVEVLRAAPPQDVVAGLTLESAAYSMLLAGDEFATWLGSQPRREAREFASGPIRAERDMDILAITLTRPENRNAFSAAIRDALFEALSAVALDTTIEKVVVAGEGPVFSSGGDLTEFGTTPDVVRAHEIRMQRSVGGLLAALAAETTASVHGSCVGAGVEVSAFCDRVVADPDSTFRLPEISMGLIPGAGGTVSITKRIGRQNTARLAILGEAIDAPTALALGLIDEIRPRAAGW